MTARRALAAASLFLLALAPARSQDALERARRALDAADAALARTALLDLFAAEIPNRSGAVSASVEVFRDAGATDLWLESAERWCRERKDDVLVHFYRGTTWQDLKHLRRADAALEQAHALAPDNPSIHEYWAWNAAWRFDAAAALERSRGAAFAGVERLRDEQERRLRERPGAAVVACALIGAVLTASTALLLRGAGRGRPES